MDECVPLRLKAEMDDLDVQTVRNMGWLGKSNGELLRSAVEAKFTIFLTVDVNLQHQINAEGLGLSIVIFKAARNRVNELRPLVPKLKAMVENLQPGQITMIED